MLVGDSALRALANNRAEGRNSAVVYKSRLVTGFWWKITDDGNVLFTKQHFISLGISLVKSFGFMANFVLKVSERKHLVFILDTRCWF